MLELAEAVIVGGGVMGVSIMAALSRRLSRVLLIDAGRIGGRATADGFAWVNASSKWHDQSYHQLNAEACSYHVALASEWTAALTGWRGGGSLFWTERTDEAALNRLSAQTNTLQTWDYPVVRVGPSEMRALEPNLVFGEDTVGLFAPAEGWAETGRLVRFLADQARQRHAFFSDYTSVVGFTRDRTGSIATVETTRGRVSTRLLVLCAGTETARLAALAAGMPESEPPVVVHASPGVLVETAPMPAHGRAFRVCYPCDPAGLHFRPTDDGGLLIGADDTDASALDGESRGQTRTPIPEPGASMRIVNRLFERLRYTAPDLPHESSGAARRCIRPIPSDGLPIVGRLPHVGGVYLLISHSGITLGPLLGQLLAEEIITGRTPPILAPYGPGRFQ